MKKHSVLRSVLSLALVLCMTLGIAVPALAADNDVIKYVSLGASNVNGYGMEGYHFHDGKNVFGYKQISPKAYPYLFSKALEEETGKTVELTQLAVSSFRAEEVHVLLDDNYHGDGYTQWRFHHINEEGFGDEWFDRCVYADGIYTENNGIPNDTTALDHLRDVYQTAVKEADVISLDIGMNNFGVYLTQRIFDYFQGIEPNFEADLSRFDITKHIPNVDALKLQMRSMISQPETMTAEEEEESESLIDFLIDTILYAYLGLITDFDASLNHIYVMNPDVDVVVVGMYNTMKGVDLIVGDTSIPLGDLMGLVLDLANSHMEKLSIHSLRTAYVDASNRHNFFEQLMVENASYANMSPEGQKTMYAYAKSMTGLEDEASIQFAADVFTQIFTKALNNPRMDMASLANMDTSGFEADVAACVSAALTTGEVDLSFLDEEPNATLGFFYCRFFFKDWFFIHPDEQGHSDAAKEIMAVYKEEFLEKEEAIKEGIQDTFDAISGFLNSDLSEKFQLDLSKKLGDVLKNFKLDLDFDLDFKLPSFSYGNYKAK